MCNNILDRIDKLNADGVDFVNFGIPPLRVHCSYTKDAIKTASYPKSPFKCWKMIKGHKFYVANIDGNYAIEILGNSKLSRAFSDLKISATLVYQGKELCVWAVSEKDFNTLCDYPKNKWKEEWGWWRYSPGSIISDYPTHLFTVNGKPMIGYYDQERLNDYAELWAEDGEMTVKEAEEDYFSRTYKGIRSYLCDVIGASTEKNVCAIAMDIATLNGLTFGELFWTYGDE